MNSIQVAKQVVLKYCAAFDKSSSDQLVSTMQDHTHPDYHWRGLHPFHEIDGVAAVCEQ
ncbi:MAG: hypothetical protein ACJAY2_000816, partial [Pseudomonadales bacterium]